MSAVPLTAHRGQLLHCLRDPGAQGAPDAVEHIPDGALLIEHGRIARAGPAEQLLRDVGPDVAVVDHAGAWLLPGLIDCHVHYPQIDAIASYGERLLPWLERYVFPLEARFGDPDLAAATAAFFLDELLRNGTTTALVFATVHPASAEAIFAAAQARGMRLAAGKVLMDRECPPALREDPDTAVRESRALIERWHGTDRLHYAVTPRFAPACSAELLRAAGDLAERYPDTLVHTHLAETCDEVALVQRRFPERRSYLDVYRHAGLVRERGVFAHCLHLDDADFAALAGAGASIAFCPSSNLFLGSGAFDLARARAHAVPVGIGSDVGGGTSVNLLRTLADGYKSLQCCAQPLHGLHALYLATLGAAEALGMAGSIGNFAPGKDADFLVVDPGATPMTARRTAAAGDIAEAFFALMHLADDRAVREVYLCGRRWDGPATD